MHMYMLPEPLYDTDSLQSPTALARKVISSAVSVRPSVHSFVHRFVSTLTVEPLYLGFFCMRVIMTAACRGLKLEVTGLSVTC